MTEPYHNSRNYFKILDAQRLRDSKPLDVTIFHEDGTIQHFVEPPRDNPKYPYRAPGVTDQIVDFNLRQGHAETAERKAKGLPPRRLGEGKNKNARRHPEVDTKEAVDKGK